MIKLSEEKFKELAKKVIKEKEEMTEELDDPILKLLVLIEVTSTIQKLETLLFN